MNKTMYYVIFGSWNFDALSKITAHIVERETDSSVWIKGRRRAKASNKHQYFDTWREAHEALQENQSNKVASALRRLEQAKERFHKINSLTPED
ncbi:MAG: hypothetical protein AAF434_17420 [Pseudomonadota bacterium]